MSEPKDLLNWVELSRVLADNSTSVSRKRIPKKYIEKVESLLTAIRDWSEDIKP